MAEGKNASVNETTPFLVRLVRFWDDLWGPLSESWRSLDLSIGILDILTLLFYLIIVFAVTVYGSTLFNYGVRHFFLAGRRYRYLPVACSMLMSNIGCSTFVRVMGLASQHGLNVYAYELHSVIAVICFGWFFSPVYMASGSITTLSYISKRYGGIGLEMLLSFLSISLIVLTRVSVELYSLYVLIQSVFSTADWITIIIINMLLFWALFTVGAGGLSALVAANTAHAFLLAAAAAVIGFTSLRNMDDYDYLKDLYMHAAPSTTKRQYGYSSCGFPAAQSWRLWRAYFNLDLPWPGMLFGIAINTLWHLCCDQVHVQSALAAKNITDVKYACLIFGYVKVLTLLFMVLPGMISRIINTDIVACGDPGVCEHYCGSRQGCHHLALPMYIITILPKGYRGLVLAAVLAAGVSTLSACFNSCGTIFTFNIYRHLRPDCSEMEIMTIFRFAVGLSVIASFALVPVVQAIPNLFDFLSSLMSYLVPPIVAIFVCGIFWERASGPSVYKALQYGIFLGAVRLVWSLQYETLPCGETVEEKMPDILGSFHFLHFGMFLFVLSLCYIGMSSIFSEPINPIHLYRLTFWLRHSKLDRVELNELNTEMEKLKSQLKDSMSIDGATHPAAGDGPDKEPVEAAEGEDLEKKSDQGEEKEASEGRGQEKEVGEGHGQERREGHGKATDDKGRTRTVGVPVVPLVDLEEDESQWIHHALRDCLGKIFNICRILKCKKHAKRGLKEETGTQSTETIGHHDDDKSSLGSEHDHKYTCGQCMKEVFCCAQYDDDLTSELERMILAERAKQMAQAADDAKALEGAATQSGAESMSVGSKAKSKADSRVTFKDEVEKEKRKKEQPIEGQQKVAESDVDEDDDEYDDDDDEEDSSEDDDETDEGEEDEKDGLNRCDQCWKWVQGWLDRLMHERWSRRMRKLCCFPKQLQKNRVTDAELREATKISVDIVETSIEESVLNLHACLLLLVTFFIWAFLA